MDWQEVVSPCRQLVGQLLVLGLMLKTFGQKLCSSIADEVRERRNGREVSILVGRTFSVVDGRIKRDAVPPGDSSGYSSGLKYSR